MKPRVIKLRNNKTDSERLINFLKEHDNFSNVPLSHRVNIENYAGRFLKIGHVLCVIEGKEIAATLGYYYNRCSRDLYASLFCNIKDANAESRAKSLIHAMCVDGKAHGLERIVFEVTDRRLMVLYRRLGAQITGEANRNHIWVATMTYGIDKFISNYARSATL